MANSTMSDVFVSSNHAVKVYKSANLKYDRRSLDYMICFVSRPDILLVGADKKVYHGDKGRAFDTFMDKGISNHTDIEKYIDEILSIEYIPNTIDNIIAFAWETSVANEQKNINNDMYDINYDITQQYRNIENLTKLVQYFNDVVIQLTSSKGPIYENLSAIAKRPIDLVTSNKYHIYREEKELPAIETVVLPPVEQMIEQPAAATPVAPVAPVEPDTLVEHKFTDNELAALRTLCLKPCPGTKLLRTDAYANYRARTTSGNVRSNTQYNSALIANKVKLGKVRNKWMLHDMEYIRT